MYRVTIHNTFIAFPIYSLRSPTSNFRSEPYTLQNLCRYSSRLHTRARGKGRVSAELLTSSAHSRGHCVGRCPTNILNWPVPILLQRLLLAVSCRIPKAVVRHNPRHKLLPHISFTLSSVALNFTYIVKILKYH